MNGKLLLSEICAQISPTAALLPRDSLENMNCDKSLTILPNIEHISVHFTQLKKNPEKVNKSTFSSEVPRSKVAPGTELCGINNALICRKTTAASVTTPLTTPSPRQIFTQRPKTRVTPKTRPTQTANPRLKLTWKPKSRPGNKAKSKSSKQNQISRRSKGKSR